MNECMNEPSTGHIVTKLKKTLAGKTFGDQFYQRDQFYQHNDENDII